MRADAALDEQTIAGKVEDVAGKLGVGELLARYPRELSGGQQQRVALGRAMVRDPKVFLLDEPLSNLDARLRIRMRKDIKALHAALGATIVYVTHDQSEAMTMSTRIAVFDHGRLQQYGTPEEIYNRPRNLFVANFVGEREINRIEGLMTGERDTLRFRQRRRVHSAAAPRQHPGRTGSRPRRTRGSHFCSTTTARFRPWSS